MIAFIALFLWAAITSRPLSMIASIGFFICLFIEPSRLKVLSIIGFFVLAVIIPFQPYAITFISAKGYPKIVCCCPGSPYGRNWQDVKKKQQAGECMFCSDISTGFNPRYFLIW
jgi:hypothetical protein